MKHEIIALIYQLAEEPDSEEREKISIRLSFKIPLLKTVNSNEGHSEKYKIAKSIKEFSTNPDSINRNRLLSLIDDIEFKFTDGIHN